MKLDLAVLSMSFVVLSNALIRYKKITSGKQEEEEQDTKRSYPHKTNKMDVEQKAGDEQKVAEATAVDPIKSQLERILLDSFAIQSIKLGDQLGIYVAMYEAQLVSEDGRLGLEDICELAKIDPRLTQEWLKLQERLGFVSRVASEDGSRFQLSLEAAKYLLPPSYSSVSMAGIIRLATCMLDLSHVVEAFETGEQTLFKPDEVPDVKLVENLGDSKSVENRIRFARESFCTKFFRDRFVDQVLLRLKDGPEIVRMLEQGEIDVAESFCGATSGTLTITMAARFRNTRFLGFETQHVSLTRARDLAHAADAKNARFYDVKERSVGFGPPTSSSKKGRKVKAGFGLVLTFMSLSMINSEEQHALFKEVRQALDPSGYWIIMDLDAQQDDLAYALCSGMSLMHFIPSMKAPDLCSLFTANRCRQLCADHGFTVMEELPTVTDEMLVRINAFALKI